ncbi:MAG: AAA family ATPase [Alphaproteobacteria bacterium]|nr:AAA family ATPase [Alphaproteobacteria bacterium]
MSTWLDCRSWFLDRIKPAGFERVDRPAHSASAEADLFSSSYAAIAIWPVRASDLLEEAEYEARKWLDDYLVELEEEHPRTVVDGYLILRLPAAPDSFEMVHRIEASWAICRKFVVWEGDEKEEENRLLRIPVLALPRVTDEPARRQPRLRFIRLKVCGFRGFRDEFALDLTQPLMLISAANGTGKTSLCQAAEWVISGTVVGLRDDSLGFDGATPTVEAWIEVDGTPYLLRRDDQHFAVYLGDGTPQDAEEWQNRYWPDARSMATRRGGRWLYAEDIGALIREDDPSGDRRKKVFADLLDMPDLLEKSRVLKERFHDAERLAERLNTERASAEEQVNRFQDGQSPPAEEWLDKACRLIRSEQDAAAPLPGRQDAVGFALLAAEGRVAKRRAALRKAKSAPPVEQRPRFDEVRQQRFKRAIEAVIASANSRLRFERLEECLARAASLAPDLASRATRDQLVPRADFGTVLAGGGPSKALVHLEELVRHFPEWHRLVETASARSERLAEIDADTARHANGLPDMLARLRQDAGRLRKRVDELQHMAKTANGYDARPLGDAATCIGSVLAEIEARVDEGDAYEASVSARNRTARNLRLESLRFEEVDRWLRTACQSLGVTPQARKDWHTRIEREIKEHLCLLALSDGAKIFESAGRMIERKNPILSQLHELLSDLRAEISQALTSPEVKSVEPRESLLAIDRDARDLARAGVLRHHVEEADRSWRELGDEPFTLTNLSRIERSLEHEAGLIHDAAYALEKSRRLAERGSIDFGRNDAQRRAERAKEAWGKAENASREARDAWRAAEKEIEHWTQTRLSMPDMNELFQRLQVNHVYDRIELDKNATLAFLAGAQEKERSARDHLSSGQRQDLALAIVLARGRRLGGTVFIDEPLEHMDEFSSAVGLELFRLVALTEPDLQLVITTAKQSMVRHLQEKFLRVQDRHHKFEVVALRNTASGSVQRLTTG